MIYVYLTVAKLANIYAWITSAYLDRRRTGRFRGLREVQVVRV